jgi:putative Flp pilus-assembly TadE/G-like protein
MKRTHRTMRSCERRSDSGQVAVLVLMVLGIFLLSVSAFGVDFANFWFHRQAAQTAADAACTAGVMDMLVNANTGSTLGGFTASTNFDCATTPGAAPCAYAALNGFNGNGATPGSTIQVSFVATSTIPGVDPASIPGLVPNTMQVDITERVQTFFSGLLTGSRTQAVRVRSRCAVLMAAAPVPLTVLNPICPSSLNLSGSSDIAIVGGPNKSIQVNSNDSAAVSGGGTINLSQGGPAFTGSLIGVYGGPQTPPGTFLPGTTGAWGFKATPIADPFANVPAPQDPTTTTPALPLNPPPQVVGYNNATYGCPDQSGCTVYKPGKYTSPIVVKNKTALFVPGLYYFAIPAGSFDNDNCGTPGGCIARPTGQCNYAVTVDSNGVVRMASNSAPESDGSQGVTFFLSGSGGTNGFGSVFFGSNAGNSGGRTVDAFSTSGVACPGGPLPNPGLSLPSTVQGNILLGPCTYDGSYTRSSTNVSPGGAATQSVRGMIFFQDRNNGNNDGQPSMQGGGGLLMSGNLYFHHCPSKNPVMGGAAPSPTAQCNPTTEYHSFFQLQGTPGSGTFLLGNITADEVNLGGNGNISMQLDTRSVYTILKAALIQ